MHLWVCCHKHYVWNLYFNISVNKVSRLGWLPFPPKSADHSVWQCICWISRSMHWRLGKKLYLSVRWDTHTAMWRNLKQIQVLIRLSLSGQSICMLPTSGSCCFGFYSMFSSYKDLLKPRSKSPVCFHPLGLRKGLCNWTGHPCEKLIFLAHLLLKSL